MIMRDAETQRYFQKEQLQSGKYDNTEHIYPLLTQEEQSYIRQLQILKREYQERQRKKG